MHRNRSIDDLDDHTTSPAPRPVAATLFLLAIVLALLLAIAALLAHRFGWLPSIDALLHP